VSLYRHPPEEAYVLCIDEMGPTSAKTYVAPRWDQQRPHVEADYGRRGKIWTFGAFEPATGQALTCCYPGRTSANFVAFLDVIADTWLGKTIYIILDNLSTHKTLDVLLWTLAHPRVRFLFQPTYAPWLNLIEPWWKTLRSLALKGRCFQIVDEIVHTIEWATNHWNHNKKPYVWRKAFS
jgi:transposase